MTFWIAVLGMMGVFYLFIGIWGTKRDNKRKKVCTQRANGTITEIRARKYRLNRYDSKDIMYHPVIEYEAGGIVRSQEYNTGSNPSKYHVGQSILLFYNKEKPEEILLEGKSLYGILAAIFGAAGIVCLLIAGALLIHM